jgi:hypothetical protein
MARRSTRSVETKARARATSKKRDSAHLFGRASPLPCLAHLRYGLETPARGVRYATLLDGT